MTQPADRKAQFVQLVERCTAERLAEQVRKHSCCVAPAVGPAALARMFRPERLPGDAVELARLASKLTDWALGLAPSTERPYADDDLLTVSG